MGKRNLRLAGPAQFGAAAATIYTVPASSLVIVRSVWIQTNDAARTFTMSIGADADGTRVYDTFSLTQFVPHVSYPGWVLAAAEVIQALASAATSVNYVLSGELYELG